MRVMPAFNAEKPSIRSNVVLLVTLMRMVPRSLSLSRNAFFALLTDTTVPSYCVAAAAVAGATETDRTRIAISAMSFIADMVVAGG